MTRKADTTSSTLAPMRIVRHPIYTGIISGGHCDGIVPRATFHAILGAAALDPSATGSRRGLKSDF